MLLKGFIQTKKCQDNPKIKPLVKIILFLMILLEIDNYLMLDLHWNNKFKKIFIDFYSLYFLKAYNLFTILI